MGSKINQNGRLYANGGRVVFVSSAKDCPKINFTYEGKIGKFKDDFSNGFRVSKKILKYVF